jgi:Tfp pilus assembly protein PilX
MNPSHDLGRTPAIFRARGNNGSVLIVAMTLAIALAMLAGGYISLTTQSMRHTQRTFHLNSAFNLAESGAEYAVWCLKNTWTLPTNDWTGDSTTRSYIGSVNNPIYTDSQGNKAFFKIRVTAANSPNPVVVAEGIVVPKIGSPVSKQIRVRLSTGGLFANGLVAKDRLTLNGGEIDSYRSSLGNPVSSPRGYEITVASTAIEIGDISLGSAADIYGSVAIGASSEAGFINTIQGQILGPTTAVGQDGVTTHGTYPFYPQPDR